MYGGTRSPATQPDPAAVAAVDSSTGGSELRSGFLRSPVPMPQRTMTLNGVPRPPLPRPHALAAATADTAKRSGFLLSRAWGTQEWKRRWCELDGSRLHIGAEASGDSSVHVQELRHATVLPGARGQPDLAPDNAFTLLAPGGVYTFQADSAAEAHEWLEALRAAVRAARYHDDPVHREGSADAFIPQARRGERRERNAARGGVDAGERADRRPGCDRLGVALATHP